jgi:hypothetical protein
MMTMIDDDDDGTAWAQNYCWVSLDMSMGWMYDRSETNSKINAVVGSDLLYS